jgi:hypothetical protein
MDLLRRVKIERDTLSPTKGVLPRERCSEVVIIRDVARSLGLGEPPVTVAG